MALSAKYKNDCVSVLDQFDLDQIKTKRFVEIIQTLKTPNALIITEDKDEKLELSARNVPGVKVMRHEGLNVYDILKYQNLVLLEASVKSIEGRLLQ
jgi:large subunit ribosomal protein L4